MNALHRCLMAPALVVLVGSSAIVGDLLCTPHDRSVWNEFGIGLLMMALVAVSYQLSRRQPRPR